MRILFLSPWFPFPPVNGSKIRIYHLLREISRRHEVHLVSFTRSGEVTDSDGLADICSSIETVKFNEFNPQQYKSWLGFLSLSPRSVQATYSQPMHDLVKRRVKELQPDVLVASELDTARYAVGIPGGARLFEDVELGQLRSIAQLGMTFPLRLRSQISWFKSTFYVRRLLRNFGACTVVSEIERQIVSTIAVGYNHIYLIPNGVDVAAFKPGLVEPQPGRLIYNGSLTFNANQDAVRYFLNEIFSMVIAQSSQAHLVVTGSTQGVDLEALPGRERTTFTGFLPDIRPAVASAWACIIPLRIGGGTRLKILEAMALGTPVVSTSKGAEGLEVTPGKDILIADTPTEFASQVIRLFDNLELRASLVSNARRLVEERYSWEYLGQRFEQVLESLVIPEKR